MRAHQSGRLAEAEACYRQIITLQPRHFDALHMLAVICAETGRYAEAEQLFEKAIAIDRKFPPCFHHFGLLFAKQNRFKEAIAQFDKAVRIAPNFAPAHCDRGAALSEIDKPKEALTSLNTAVRLAPQVPMVWYNRGNAYSRAGNFTAAQNDYNEALRLNGNYADAWVGRGHLLFRSNRDQEALACFDRALALRNDFPDALWNKALLKLSQGAYAEGWKLYEWRWQYRSFPSMRRNFDRPQWSGHRADLAGKTILVHAEQGLGDTIQFCRYLRLFEALDCRVVFECQPPLISLFKGQGWSCQIVEQGQPLPAFDLHSPLLSLPLAFNTVLETIPNQVPYLVADAIKRDLWRARLGSRPKPRIGLVWSGNPSFRDDRSRSIALERLLPIISDKAEWHSLQKDVREVDREVLMKISGIQDFTQLISDFSDTAAIIAELDLIISVDTAVAHLAGALGKSVWLLLPFHPDFRWLREIEHSPWYPTARLFRQRRDGEWDDVVVRVRAGLDTSNL